MRVFSITVAAVVLTAGIAVANVAPAAAADSVSVTFDAGNVAFGYTDGYWDNDHHWHTWKNADEARVYKEQHKENYHEWKHDRDPDKGWHDR